MGVEVEPVPDVEDETDDWDDELADDPDGATSRVVRDRTLGGWLVVAGLIGLVAATTLLVEKIHLLQDPSYVPSCSINPVLSCGSVMQTPQAELLGFPNPVMGVAAFPILVTVGVVLLTGAALPRWFWLGLQVGVTAGLGLVLWLADQSLYEIGALCPYCMVVWAIVWPTFLYTTLRNLETGTLGGERAASSRLVAGLTTWHAPLLLLGYLVVVVAIGQRFWDYWSTLF